MLGKCSTTEMHPKPESIVLLLVVLGFELRASHLIGRLAPLH
jgi:hypothetical protein